MDIGSETLGFEYKWEKIHTLQTPSQQDLRGRPPQIRAGRPSFLVL